jgi:hypothetical protein
VIESRWVRECDLVTVSYHSGNYGEGSVICHVRDNGERRVVCHDRDVCGYYALIRAMGSRFLVKVDTVGCEIVTSAVVMDSGLVTAIS